MTEEPTQQPRDEGLPEDEETTGSETDAHGLDGESDDPSLSDAQAVMETPEEPLATVDEPTEVKEPAETSDEEPEETEEGEETEEEEGEDEDEDLTFRFLPGDWYVVHTYAGYENKVRANLGSRIQSMNMEDKIYDVVVPTEEVMELKSGKMQAVKKKVFPGYILVRMDLDDDSWYVVRNTPGVTGFVGTGAKPTPLEEAEVKQILAPTPEAERRLGPQLEFDEGEVVTVTAGAFSGYSGPITDIMVDKQLVRVLLNLFGRETPVDVPLDQVEKL